MFQKQRQLLWNRSWLLAFLSNRRDTPHLILFLFDNKFRVLSVHVYVWCSNHHSLSVGREKSKVIVMLCRYAPLLFSASVSLILLTGRGEKCFVGGVPISETYGKWFFSIFPSLSTHFFPYFPASSLNLLTINELAGETVITDFYFSDRFYNFGKNTAVTRPIDESDSFWRTAPFEIANQTSR